MRDIKFRLIRDNKVVGWEQPMIQPNGIFSWIYQVNYIAEKGELSGPSGWSGTFIKHDIKNQAAGYADKNGKDIYEGDILIFEDTYTEPILDDGSGPTEPCNHLSEVIFKNGAFGVDVKDRAD